MREDWAMRVTALLLVIRRVITPPDPTILSLGISQAKPIQAPIISLRVPKPVAPIPLEAITFLSAIGQDSITLRHGKIFLSVLSRAEIIQRAKGILFSAMRLVF